jgi:ABC-2 type transport system permease protein
VPAARPFHRIACAVIPKGSTLGQLQYDTLALAGLMAVAMTVAVTRWQFSSGALLL